MSLSAAGATPPLTVKGQQEAAVWKLLHIREGVKLEVAVINGGCPDFCRE